MLNRPTIRSLLLLTLALVFVQPVAGAPQNVTCDDQLGCNVFSGGAIIDFIPSNKWNQGSTCTICALHPQKSQLYDQTWHSSTLNLRDTEQYMFNITFHGVRSSSFLKAMEFMLSGMAIYTFFILPDNSSLESDGIVVLTNMSVFLDDELVGSILRIPQNKTDFIYNFPGYANASLSNDSHVLSVSANNQAASSVILFDYYVYTYAFSL